MDKTLLIITFCSGLFFTAIAQNSKIDSLQRVLDMQVKIDTSFSNILNKLAYEYRKINPKKSRVYSQKALKNAQKLNFKKGVADAYHTLAISYWVESDYDKALSLNLRALKIRNEINDQKGIAYSLNSTGALYSQTHDYAKALNCYFEALKIFKTMDAQKCIPMTYNNIGVIYAKQYKNKKAKVYYLKALKGYQALDNKSGIATTLSNMGKTHEEERDFQKALMYYEKALSIDEEEQNDKQGMAITLKNMGVISLELKDYPKSLYLLKKSLKIAKEIGSKRIESQSYEVLARYYEKQEQFEQAFSYYRRFNELNDSIFNSETSQQISQMQNKYDMDMNERKNIAQIHLIELLQRDKKINAMMRYLFIVGLLALMVVSILIINRQRMKSLKNKELYITQQALVEADLKNAEQALVFKNKELTTNALQIIQKNNVLKDLRDSIEEVASEMDQKNAKKIKKLIHLINHSFNLDKDWEDFRVTFEQVHQEFFNSLQKRLPNISSSEMRLCCLLKLNFSSKEIADIMSISPDSVKVARYRLRKRFGLTRTDNLTDFVMNI